MRITEAARRLDMTPRMLRYRESLGLLPVVRQSRRRQLSRSRTDPPAMSGADSTPVAAAAAAFRPHRQFTEADLAAVSLGLAIERRYDVSPAALAFGIRVLADSRVRADVAELGRRIGRIQPPPARALDFEKERAQRLLRLAERDR
jgi:MerR family transcriptional regulator, copper efflux regulator